MLANFMPTGAEYAQIAPEIILIVVGTLIMLLEAVMGEGRKPIDRKSTRLNSSHIPLSRMPSSA